MIVSILCWILLAVWVTGVTGLLVIARRQHQKRRRWWSQ